MFEKCFPYIYIYVSLILRVNLTIYLLIAIYTLKQVPDSTSHIRWIKDHLPHKQESLNKSTNLQYNGFQTPAPTQGSLVSCSFPRLQFPRILQATVPSYLQVLLRCSHCMVSRRKTVNSRESSLTGFAEHAGPGSLVLVSQSSHARTSPDFRRNVIYFSRCVEEPCQTARSLLRHHHHLTLLHGGVGPHVVLSHAAFQARTFAHAHVPDLWQCTPAGGSFPSPPRPGGRRLAKCACQMLRLTGPRVALTASTS